MFSRSYKLFRFNEILSSGNVQNSLDEIEMLRRGGASVNFSIFFEHPQFDIVMQQMRHPYKNRDEYVAMVKNLFFIETINGWKFAGLHAFLEALG